jgi:hypothetical protein
MALKGGMGYIFMDKKSKRNRQSERVRLRCIIRTLLLKRNRIRGCGLDSFEKERRKLCEFVKKTKFVVSIKNGEFLKQLRNYQIFKIGYVL